IDTATADGSGSLMFSGQMNAAPGTYTLDFYTSPTADPTGFGQGKNYIGSLTVTVGSSGHATWNVTFLHATSSDQYVTATATDGSGNTSEFSAATSITVTAPTPDATSTSLSSSANPSSFGQSVTFTATVTDLVHGGTIPGGIVEFKDGNTLLGIGT